MIDPKELRVGNIVDYFSDNLDRWFNRRAISENDLCCLLSGDDRDHADPVKLTEEWLLKFGFELKRIDEDDTFERYQLPIPKTSWYLANVITYGSVTLFNNRDHTSTGVGAQYVHQLQNLFYALCGEELTIKQG